jgi:hypothetical protein
VKHATFFPWVKDEGEVVASLYGLDPVLSETHDFPVSPEAGPVENCLQVVKESYASELSHIFDECFVGIGKETVIPIERVVASARRHGVPDELAREMYRAKVRNYSA